jgi:hypothetical protein
MKSAGNFVIFFLLYGLFSVASGESGAKSKKADGV